MNQKLFPEIEKFFHCQYAIPVGGGMAGIYLILKFLEVKNKKVLIPAITGWTVPVAVIAAGGIPILIDVSPDDCNICIDSVKKAMDKDVAAIIAVDSFGYPVNIEKLKEIASPYHSTIIEDSCHSYGGFVNGDVIGNRADVGTISFGYSKPIVAEGGGFIITDNLKIYEGINEIHNSWRYNFLKNVKNKLKVKLVLKSKYKALRFFTNYLYLIEYNFPSKTENQFSELWDRFINGLDEVKYNMQKVHNIIYGLNGIETFKYKKIGWLPWRYSFKIPGSETKRYFKQMAKETGIKYSRLYPPLTHNYRDLKVHENIKEANRIGTMIFNLKYDITPESTENLVNEIKYLREGWEMRR